MLDSKKPDVRLIIAKMNEIASKLDILNTSAPLLVKKEKFNPLPKPKLASMDTLMLTPLTPFSNKMAIWDAIRSCDAYLNWIDKYFSIAGLRMLSEALDKSKVKKVRILVSVDKADDGLRSLFKDFREEMNSSGVDCEMRVITDPKVKTAIHDRWIIASNKCFNVPSPDTVERGQHSEIKPTYNFPPFADWWDGSLDIIERWNEIQSIKGGLKK